jgi:hypothetical protein
VLPVLDDFEVQVASGGGSGGTDLGNHLTDADVIALLNGDAPQVVVRGDQAISMVDLNPVAAAPRVPTGRPDHAGVGSIDPGSTGGGEVLAPVEFSGLPGQGIVTQPER